jgi:hypothetical protein
VRERLWVMQLHIYDQPRPGLEKTPWIDGTVHDCITLVHVTGVQVCSHPQLDGGRSCLPVIHLQRLNAGLSDDKFR